MLHHLGLMRSRCEVSDHNFDLVMRQDFTKRYKS